MKKFLAFTIALGVVCGAVPAHARWVYESTQTDGDLSSSIAYTTALNGDALVAGCINVNFLSLDYLIPASPSDLRQVQQQDEENQSYRLPPPMLSITIDGQRPILVKASIYEWLPFPAALSSPIFGSSYLDFTTGIMGHPWAGSLIQKIKSAKNKIKIQVIWPLAGQKSHQKMDVFSIDSAKKSIQSVMSSCSSYEP